MKVVSFNYQTDKNWENLEEAKKCDDENSVLFAFFSQEFKENQKIFNELKSHFPKATVVGCTTSGEISQDHVKDHSITCAIMKMGDSRYKVQSIPIESAENSFEVGKELASSLNDKDLKAVFVMSDGLNANGSELVRGINSVVDEKETVVSGGLAGDGNDFSSTYIVDDGELKSNRIVAVGFYGDTLNVSCGSRGGWDIFGPERTITKSSGNILYEIDGQPALKLYKEYLGEKAKDLPSSGLFFPLQIKLPDSDKKLVRTILGIDEETQSLVFAGDVPKNSQAQLMRANFDRVIDGAAEAGEMANSENQEKVEGDSIVLAVSCVGRRLVLGARSDDEIEVLNEASEGSHVIGFYSYGEICPIENGSPCELHNQSMTVMKLYEKKAA